MGRHKKIKTDTKKQKKVKTVEVLNVGYMDIGEAPTLPKYSNYVECIMDLFIKQGLKNFMKEQMSLLNMNYVQFYTDKYLSEMVYSEIQLFYQGRIDYNVLKADIVDLCKRYKETKM